MPDIMVCLACLRQYLDWTTLGRLSRVTEALLAMTGRVTMRGLARWAGHRQQGFGHPAQATERGPSRYWRKQARNRP